MSTQVTDARIRMVMDSHEDIDRCTVYTVDNQIYLEFNGHNELLGPFVACEIVSGMVMKLKAGDYSTPIHYVKSIKTDNWEYADKVQSYSTLKIAETRATRYVQKYLGKKDIKEIMNILENRVYGSAETQTISILISFEEVQIWDRPHLMVIIGTSAGMWDIQSQSWLMPLSKTTLSVVKSESNSMLDYITFSDGDNTLVYLGNGNGAGGLEELNFGRMHIAERINKETWLLTGYFGAIRQVIKVVNRELAEVLVFRLGDRTIRINGEDIELSKERALTFTNESGKELQRKIPAVVILESDRESTKCGIVEYLKNAADTDSDMRGIEGFRVDKTNTLHYNNKEYTLIEVAKDIVYGALK